MPRRTDIQKIAIIGAGPIIIGQACEFDYSGTQACQALRAEGYQVVLINSNPATIMTDPELANRTYVEPITPAIVTRILEIERPDVLLPTMGGQTALNVAMQLARDGTLARLGIELIGANRAAIEKAEDRLQFREAMTRIGLASPRSQLVRTLPEALAALEEIGLPAVIRPSFTLGGTGGGIAYNRTSFAEIVQHGLSASLVGEVLVEESVLGWKEYELEVVRDRADNCIIVCSIENIDPMGVHTGDSVTVAPALTLTDKEYQRLRSAAIAVLREIGVDTGGANVQFAINPADGRVVVIEMNPRVSRSSALASKATGFPIAKVAARLAVGYTLNELTNDITGTPASFEPTIDYVVTKIPRFAFEKFHGAEPLLGTAMKSVGEVMALGRSWLESMQKALRSLETGLTGFDEMGLADAEPLDIRAALARATPERLLLAADALRAGMSVAAIQEITHFDPWYLEQLALLVATEAEIRRHGLPETPAGLLALKRMGFSDTRLAHLCDSSAAAVSAHRAALGVHPVYKRIDTCAAEFSSLTPYLYSTYETVGAVCEAAPSERRKVIILGGGPNRIGQGIEFDYCCVHAVQGLRSLGIETIMVNCNPETVSTDYDTADRLYFEPLCAEDVLEICRLEMQHGTLVGVLVQYGGQTPLRLAHDLAAAGIPILGTSVAAIDLAEDRERFAALISRLQLRQPESGVARDAAEAIAVAERIGYPVLLRPSYVLGGRAMEIVYDREGLQRYISQAVRASAANPVLVDQYLRDAGEVDVDLIADGETVFIAGVMEHIEEAGIHSGDSACCLPPYSLSPDLIAAMQEQSRILARALGVRGLMNVQFAVKNGQIFVLEVNPRASRTVPFVAKATGVPVARIGAQVMAGVPLASFGLREGAPAHVAVKESVFPFARFPGVDVLFGPEMKSTGEVIGLDRDFAFAFAKAQLAAGIRLPLAGTVFLSVRDSDKPLLPPIARDFQAAGFGLVATAGTAEYLAGQGVIVKKINKVLEGSPHVLDALIDGRIALVINTTETKQAIADSFSIRRMALMRGIPQYSTLAEARAVLRAIAALQSETLAVTALQDYFVANTELRHAV